MFHEHEGIAGYRKIHKYLINDGFPYSVEQVRKAMSLIGLQSIAQAKKKFNKPGAFHEAFPRLVKKDFRAIKPNQLWYTDFTYLKLDNGKFVYACVFIDAFDLSIVGFKISKNINVDLAIDTLKIAMKKFKVDSTLIIHSDQGIQYRAKRFVSFCKTNNIIQSMSRAGTPTDNPYAEGFMSKLKTERFKHRVYSNINEVTEDLTNWCYIYYNTKRINQGNDYMTPLEFRNNYEIENAA